MLFEFDNGYTLHQQGLSIIDNITRSDGRYKFSAHDLVSQYVMLIVDGYYRNVVTGSISNNPIQLKLISNLMLHKTASVNLLAHLEFKRLNYLVTQEKLTVLQAKRKAQKEIRTQFYIELDDTTDAEEMDVFGKTDRDAALLAISILLQGDRTEAELTELLTSFSMDIASDGEWNDSTTIAAIADWISIKDSAGEIKNFRRNAEKWMLDGSIGDFEKHLRNYWYMVYGLGSCSESGVVKKNQNLKSSRSDNYFICKEGCWRDASDAEIASSKK